jgi:hypothetical protein
MGVVLKLYKFYSLSSKLQIILSFLDGVMACQVWPDPLWRKANQVLLVELPRVEPFIQG